MNKSILFFTAVIIFCIGSITQNMLDRLRTSNFSFPKLAALSCKETDRCEFKITPNEFRLRIVSPEKFYKNEEQNLLAYSFPYKTPCEIVLPAKYLIKAEPLKGIARWSYQDINGKFTGDVGNTLAHEILHCFAGNWHEDWKLIKLRSEEQT